MRAFRNAGPAVDSAPEERKLDRAADNVSRAEISGEDHLRKTIFVDLATVSDHRMVGLAATADHPDVAVLSEKVLLDKVVLPIAMAVRLDEVLQLATVVLPIEPVVRLDADRHLQDASRMAATTIKAADPRHNKAAVLKAMTT